MKLDQQSSISLKISFVESQCTFYVTLQNCNHNTYHKILKKTNFKENSYWTELLEILFIVISASL